MSIPCPVPSDPRDRSRPIWLTPQRENEIAKLRVMQTIWNDVDMPPFPAEDRDAQLELLALREALGTFLAAYGRARFLRYCLTLALDDATDRRL